MITQKTFVGVVRTVKAKDGKEYDILLFSSDNGMTCQVAYEKGKANLVKGQKYFVDTYKNKQGYWKSFLCDLK